MSDFAKFCPKCYTFFSDPDLFAKHVETCGVAKKAADGKQQAATEKKTDRKRQLAAEKSQEQGGRNPSTEHTNEQNGAGNESPDSLSPDASSAAVCNLPSAVSTEGSAKPTKFKT